MANTLSVDGKENIFPKSLHEFPVILPGSVSNSRLCKPIKLETSHWWTALREENPVLFQDIFGGEGHLQKDLLD